MKIAAVTMVFRDYEMLSRWCDYYGTQLGRENLYIVSHGFDPHHKEITEGCNLVTIPRDKLTDFDAWRFEMLHSFVQFLCASYEWVIRTDADEFVVADSSAGTLPQILERQVDPYVFALGVEVFQGQNEPELTSQPITAQRRHGLVWASYSKAFAVKAGWRLENHGIRFDPRKLTGLRVNMPEGLYLLHMRLSSTSIHQAHRDRKVLMPSAPRSWRNIDRWEQQLHDAIALGPVEDSTAHLRQVWAAQNKSRLRRIYHAGKLRPVVRSEFNRVVELPVGIVGRV